MYWLSATIPCRETAKNSGPRTVSPPIRAILYSFASDANTKINLSTHSLAITGTLKIKFAQTGVAPIAAMSLRFTARDLCPIAWGLMPSG